MAYLSAINADNVTSYTVFICHIILDEICLTVKPDFIISPILLRQTGKKKDMAPSTMSFLNYESLTAPTVQTHLPGTYRRSLCPQPCCRLHTGNTISQALPEASP